MLISDWSSDVCSSDLPAVGLVGLGCIERQPESMRGVKEQRLRRDRQRDMRFADIKGDVTLADGLLDQPVGQLLGPVEGLAEQRSEERRVGKEGVSQCRSRGSPAD